MNYSFKNEYNNAKDGPAISSNSRVGVIVHTTSNGVLCVNFEASR